MDGMSLVWCKEKSLERKEEPVIIQCCVVEIYKTMQGKWRTVSSWNLGDSESLKETIASDRFGEKGWPTDSMELVPGTVDPSMKMFTAAELPMHFEEYGIMYASMIASLRPLTGQRVRVLMYRYQE